MKELKESKESKELKIFYNSSISFIFLIFLTTGCVRQNPQLPANTPDVDTLAENLIEYNRICIEDERREIEAYIDSVETADGVRFELTDYGCYVCRHPERSEGSHNVVANAIADGDAIAVAYSKELLDGTICSQSNNGKALKFTVGKREVIKGLDLAVIGRSVGDEFDVIIPYNLAYGITGDLECVPPMTPVLYRIKIVSKNA